MDVSSTKKDLPCRPQLHDISSSERGLRIIIIIIIIISSSSSLISVSTPISTRPRSVIKHIPQNHQRGFVRLTIAKGRDHDALVRDVEVAVRRGQWFAFAAACAVLEALRLFNRASRGLCASPRGSELVHGELSSSRIGSLLEHFQGGHGSLELSRVVVSFTITTTLCLLVFLLVDR